MFSPGLDYLLRSLPLLVTYPLLAFTILHYLERQWEFSLPKVVLVALSLISQPAVFWVSGIFTRIRNKRRAKAFGAVLPPQVQESNFQVISKLRNITNDYPVEVFKNWSDQHGTIYGFNVFSEYRMFTTDPEHVKALLATQFNEFGKGPSLFEQFKSLLGTGVFNSDAEMWKFHRTMTRPFFSKDRISDFDVFDRHAEDALSQIKARLAEGYPIEFLDAVARFTLDSATEFLFGKDVGSLSAGLPYPPGLDVSGNVIADHPSNKFVDAFMSGQISTSERARFGVNWPLIEITGDKVKPRRRIINQFIDPIIEGAIARHKARVTLTDEAEKEEETMLEHLVRHTDDYKTIQDELVNILVASRDTTANTLAFAVYMLSEHPDIVARLRQEILTQVGPTRRPDYSDIREMKYLRAFLNEVLRLYPTVPVNARTSFSDAVLPKTDNTGGRPVFVPKGTKVLYSVFWMHRRTDLWGADAGKFDPDRFIDDRLKKYLTPNPFIFLPFNAGPRICLGQQFAYNEASFFLIRLLQNFSEFSLAQDVQPEETKPPSIWKNCPGTKGTDKIRFQLGLTMTVEGGMWVRMKEVA